MIIQDLPINNLVDPSQSISGIDPKKHGPANKKPPIQTAKQTAKCLPAVHDYRI
jgi:hypothetical protein